MNELLEKYHKVKRTVPILGYIKEIILPAMGQVYEDSLRDASDNRYSMLCPLHYDTNPSFYIFTKYNKFCCLADNRHGSVVMLYKAFYEATTGGKMTLREATIELFNKYLQE